MCPYSTKEKPMNIGAVITKARDMYTMDGILIPEPSGVTREEGGYWVDAFVWVPKGEETEPPRYRMLQSE
jgi:hypothetical protein